MIASWFQSGRAIDLGLLVLLAELVWAARRRELRAFLPQICAGAALLLALRASLTGSSWTVVAAFVTASLPAHALDFWSRHRPTRQRLSTSKGG